MLDSNFVEQIEWAYKINNDYFIVKQSGEPNISWTDEQWVMWAYLMEKE